MIVTDILLDQAWSLPGGGRWLVLGGEAALVDGVAERIADLWWIPVDVRERDAATSEPGAGRTLPGASCDVVVLPCPPERDFARYWMLVARELLKPGGMVLAAGANDAGIKPQLADLGDLFVRPVDEGYRRKHRFARFVAPAALSPMPTWGIRDGVLPGTRAEFAVPIGGEAVSFSTQAGVFSWDRLDDGTALLLRHLGEVSGKRVLDVGCGIGVIGCAAGLMGANDVAMTDVNLIAVELAARNAAAQHVPAHVVASDVYDRVPGRPFDLIASNPPFHRGKRVDGTVADRLIRESPLHLAPDGRLLLVANRFLPYDAVMAEVFGRVQIVAETRAFRVIEARDPL